jgi:hypothetical protein
MIRSLFLLTFLLSLTLSAQITSETIASSVLGKSRTIDLYVPEMKEGAVDPLPLIVVFEGHELFDLVVTNVKFFSKIGYMPKAIVVGIRQEEPYQMSRDFEIDKNSGQLTSRSLDFKQFVRSDVVKRLATQYPLSNLKVIIGKNKGANFLNYFLLDGSNLFSSYIAITPDLPAQIIDPLLEKASSTSKQASYYLFNSENLPERQQNKITFLGNELKNIMNDKLNITYDLFSFPDEFSSPAYSIPIALETVFRIYQPISPKEYREQMLSDTVIAHSYMVDKYEKISRQLGFQKTYILNDIMAVFAAAQKKSDAESIFVLGELCMDQYPETMMGHYFNGIGYEITENYKKALKSYERAYSSEPIDFITKEMILNKIESLK